MIPFAVGSVRTVRTGAAAVVVVVVVPAEKVSFVGRHLNSSPESGPFAAASLARFEPLVCHRWQSVPHASPVERGVHRGTKLRSCGRLSYVQELSLIKPTKTVLAQVDFPQEKRGRRPTLGVAVTRCRSRRRRSYLASVLSGENSTSPMTLAICL